MVSNQNFILTEIPQFNPFSLDFTTSDGWWGQEKRKCIEGYWSGGKWMPGGVYFYVNFWKIKLTVPGTKAETIGRPFLRDLEWEKGYLDVEARGFSGFELDEEYSCHRLLIPNNPDLQRELVLMPENIKKSIFNSKGELKKYTPARAYLRKIYPKSLGKPLFYNDSKNIIDLEARGGGKSYFSAALIAHNFLFDGAVDYDEYLEAKRSKNYITSQTVVGAIDGKYSKDLLNKVALGLSELPGGIKYDGKYFPCPLFKSYVGSFNKPGDYIESVREIQIGKNWIREGSRSSIHHRTFKDNPLAANGTRPNRVWLEEIGFHNNLRQTLGALYDCTTKDTRQFGVIWMQGTGGDMDSGATLEAEYVFYHPEEFNCLIFKDEWDGYTTPIGFFVPKHKTLNDCKDSEGNTLIDVALTRVNQVRETKAKAKDKSVISLEMQNNPEKPSEAFLTPESSYFPTFELKEHIKEVQGFPEKYLDINYTGIIKYELAQNKFIWEDVQNLSPIRDYPIKDKLEGCYEMFEYPKANDYGVTESYRYIAGIDPYDKDDSTTDSLGSMFILDRLTDRLVFEYTGRPERANIFYENCRRALIYYNATAMYESNNSGLYLYFEHKKSLNLLADTPEQLRDWTIWKENTNTSKGIPATENNNKRGREFLDNWLREETGDGTGRLRLHTIRSLALLKELSKWNININTDRVSAMGMLMWYRESLNNYSEFLEAKRNKTSKNKYNNYFSKFKKKTSLPGQNLWDETIKQIQEQNS